MTPRSLVALVAVIVAAGIGAAAAHADGDPASDFLLSQDTFVPFDAKIPRTQSEQLNAIASGQVMAGVNSTGFGPAVDSGRLRLLVTFAAQRSKRWPKVPTLRELGFDIVAMSPYGLAGPRGLPAGVVATLHDAFKRAMFDPHFIQEIAKYDQEIDYLGSEDYARSCREIYARERINVDRLATPRRPSHGG